MALPPYRGRLLGLFTRWRFVLVMGYSAQFVLTREGAHNESQATTLFGAIASVIGMGPPHEAMTLRQSLLRMWHPKSCVSDLEKPVVSWNQGKPVDFPFLDLRVVNGA